MARAAYTFPLSRVLCYWPCRSCPVPFHSCPFRCVPFHSRPTTLSREPNKRHQLRHGAQVPLIPRVLPPALQARPLQQGHPRQAADEEVVEQGTEHQQVTAPRPASRGGHVQAEPQQDLAKVVGVPADGPEASADELALRNGKGEEKVLANKLAWI